MARKKLGEMLIEAGVLDPDALQAALGEQRRWGKALGRIVVEMGMVSEDALVGVLARQLGVTTVDLDKVKISRSVLDLVPSELAQRHRLIPFAQPMKFLDIAMADPTNTGIVDELRIRTQLNIRSFLAGPRMIERAIATYYGGAEIDIPVDGLDLPVIDSPAMPPVRMAGPVARGRVLPPSVALPAPTRDAEIDALQQRMSDLEGLVGRDEEVLRKLLALLIDKGIATREEILERLK